MAECNHVFIGKSNGVYCSKCGKYMTGDEYTKFVNNKNKPKRQTRKKVKTDE